MRTSDFDFELPEELIAQHPTPSRDESRLMVLRRQERSISHHQFFELPELLNPTDLLVRNRSKVLPARLHGIRAETGGRWEGLYLNATETGLWELLTKTRGRPKPGEIIEINGGLLLTIVEVQPEGKCLVRPNDHRDPELVLNEHGTVPLPPYIRQGIEGPDDRERYQTRYAVEAGSVAAPTAGLHFSDNLLEQLDRKGIASVDLTLHVGIGTFRPIQVDQIDQHQMHPERFEFDPASADLLNEARRDGGRIIAVGTTSGRVLETTADERGLFHTQVGETSIYIRPGHRFTGLDALITNFHLPRSSLLVFVSALTGLDFLHEAYRTAIQEGYRFYSYGDAMLIL